MKKTVLILLAVLVVIILIGGVVYWKQRASSDAGTERAIQAEALLIQVGEHILLPEGEAPVIATIDNAEELAQEQAFFKHSQNGDKLIIYAQAKQAFIYSPSRDMIVAAGPTTFEAEEQATPDSPSEEETD